MSATNVARQLGQPERLATFADPVSYVGWGYPSVWRDSTVTRLLYQANVNHSRLPRVQLLAESVDDVHFQQTNTTQLPIAQRLRPKQVPEPNVGTERGCVLDDAGVDGVPSARRLKMLMANASVVARSHDWAPEKMGSHDLRAASQQRLPDGGVAVLSRPPALRHGGRHAGIHSMRGIHARGTGCSTASRASCACCPSTRFAITPPRYGNMTLYVGFLTRYRCAPEGRELQLWFWGHISGELAYSYDGLAWRRLGQTAAPTGELRLMD